MFEQSVAAGIHLLRYAEVNCYIVQDGERFMLVDAGPKCPSKGHGHEAEENHVFSSTNPAI